MSRLTKAVDVKRERLLAVLADYAHVAVAFSAGVDSTVVAQAAFLACGDQSIAFTAVSPSLATGEKECIPEWQHRAGLAPRFLY